MVDRCVSCGAPVPEGRQICITCEKCYDNYNKMRCPECGSGVKLMDVCEYATKDQVFFCKLYHCNTCHSDWESICDDIDTESTLTRKFWG